MELHTASELWYWMIAVLLFGLPIARIVERTGRSRWWFVVFLIPGVNIVAVWTLAFVRWPAVDRSTAG